MYMLVASKVISDILGVSVTANELSAKPVERMASSSLLSLTFEVNTTSEFTTAQTVSKLQSSIDGGSFANASLTTYGINVVSAMVNELADVDISKSPQPPASILPASTSSSGSFANLPSHHFRQIHQNVTEHQSHYNSVPRQILNFRLCIRTR